VGAAWVKENQLDPIHPSPLNTSKAQKRRRSGHKAPSTSVMRGIFDGKDMGFLLV
jgi:hypothetical protein